MILLVLVIATFAQEFNWEIEEACKQLKKEHPEWTKYHLEPLSRNPLHLAAAVGNLPAVSHYVEKLGYDINLRDSHIGETPLIYAAESGKLEIVEYLLKKKAKINMQSKTQCTALMYAIANNHEEVVRTLLAHNARLANSLMIGTNSPKIIRMLMLRGAPFSISYFRFQAFEKAFGTIHKDIILNRPLDMMMLNNAIYECDAEGTCILSYAATRQNLKLVLDLIMCGSSLFNKNKIGNSALAHVSRILQRTDLIEQERENYQKIHKILFTRMCHIQDALKQMLPQDLKNLIKSYC